MTTRKQIAEWLNNALEQKASHMLVVCDTFDWEDYPVLVTKSQSVKEVIQRYSDNMQRVEEVYDLSLDIEKQLNERRAYNV